MPQKRGAIIARLSAEDETKAATKGILFRKEAVQVSLLEKAAQQNSRTIAQLVRALP